MVHILLPAWLIAAPSEQARQDSERVVIDTQHQAGIDLPTDGEFYRFDINHPETNGMIDYFIRPPAGIRENVGFQDWQAFQGKQLIQFRRKPADVVESAIGEGSLNLPADCQMAADVAGGPFKFTVTSRVLV